MVEILPDLILDNSELQFTFIRASGPGGQNVNKVATACQLRFNISHTEAISSEVKERLIKLAGSRITNDGVLVIEAKRYRTQEQNKLDAINRLAALVRTAMERPIDRIKTRPTRSSSAARVNEKKHHGGIKRTRRSDPNEWE
ncbi:MAG: aminoacyl-tRNA hydrolase [Anaerolineaceae bacterium]|nr:aminoacyl-tRNA hydrolase [Anaerolineaceae bacterium]